ncbi:MAG: hypothetical protein JXR53_09360 [Bacteroidales bacterium]|nr:hypothetical protein [Bacteroidales bacterium]
MDRFELLRQFDQPLPEFCILPEHYRLDMTSDLTECTECMGPLRIQWAVRVHPVSLSLGHPSAVLHVKCCQNCGKTVYPEQYEQLSPKNWQYSYETMIEVAKLRHDNLQDKEIQQKLQLNYGVTIPLATISVLANRFLDYYSVFHYNHSAVAIKTYLKNNGGYVLHIDGTCETKGCQMHFSVIDGISDIILATYKMKGENKKDISILLKKCVEKFGHPLAVVCDLSQQIKAAVQHAIGSDIPFFVCQFHFLEKVGAKIFDQAYTELCKVVRKSKIKASIYSLYKELKRNSGAGLIPAEELKQFMDSPETALKQGMRNSQARRSMAYILLEWILDFKTEANGEYYPFSIPVAEYVKRCQRAMEAIGSVFNENKNGKLEKGKCKTLQTIYEKLTDFFANNECISIYMDQLQAGSEIFDKTRSFLRMQSEKGQPVNRQNCEAPQIDVSEEVSIELFTKELEMKAEESDLYRKPVQTVKKYFIKYEENLSGHMIRINENIVINVYRTNNIMEHFFGAFKRRLRGRIGVRNLRRQIDLMHPAAMLAENLGKEKYMKIVGCNDVHDFASIFAQYDQEAWEEQNSRKAAENKSTHIPKKMIRNKTFLGNFTDALKKSFAFLFKAS